MYFRVPNLPMDTIRTTTLIQEMTTDGHSPLKFLCEDFNVYFAKYRTRASLNPLEIDCLFYEVVCCRLLQRLGIPTPELAIIEISSNSFSRDQLTMHRRHCRPGVLYLGSKEVKNADLIQAIAPISSRRDFKKFTNPYHLIGIAFFDLWVNNRDRGRSDNYNLCNSIRNKGEHSTHLIMRSALVVSISYGCFTLVYHSRHKIDCTKVPILRNFYHI